MERCLYQARYRSRASKVGPKAFGWAEHFRILLTDDPPPSAGNVRFSRGIFYASGGICGQGVKKSSRSRFFPRKLRAGRDFDCGGMAKLTKRDIVVAISNQTGMVQHQVFDVVQRTLDHITDSLANNVAVELRNFGVFQPRLTKPRVGRNPNEPGSSFVIPARATVKFKPGKIMRQRVEKLSRELKDASERKAASNVPSTPA